MASPDFSCTKKFRLHHTMFSETSSQYALTIHVQCHYVTRPYRLRRLKYFYYAMTSWNLIPHSACTINVLCHNVAGPYCLMHSQYIYYAMMSRDLTALFVHNTFTMPWCRETLPPYLFTIHVLCHNVARPYHLICSQYMNYAMTSRDLTALCVYNTCTMP